MGIRSQGTLGQEAEKHSSHGEGNILNFEHAHGGGIIKCFPIIEFGPSVYKEVNLIFSILR
jgi:hypothetical protein